MTSGYRIKGKGRRLVPSDSKEPHQCVILAVDPATETGYCVMFLGEVQCSGSFTTHANSIVCAIEYALMQPEDVPVVLVLEKPFARNPETSATLLGIRRQWIGIWRHRMRGLGHAGKVANVYPQTWRSRVLGVTTGEDVERGEFSVARSLVYPPGASVTRDEAAAICIAKWGSTAGEVAKVIPKRFWGSSE